MPTYDNSHYDTDSVYFKFQKLNEYVFILFNWMRFCILFLFEFFFVQFYYSKVVFPKAIADHYVHDSICGNDQRINKFNFKNILFLPTNERGIIVSDKRLALSRVRNKNMLYPSITYFCFVLITWQRFILFFKLGRTYLLAINPRITQVKVVNFPSLYLQSRQR